ncbi:MAG: hypothetical protein H6509_16285 [Bryobacterales bacterium]|nr:hypothetical protein [Bryobacterales bacterium]
MALVIHELTTNAAKYGALCYRDRTSGRKLAEGRRGDLEIAWVGVAGR